MADGAQQAIDLMGQDAQGLGEFAAKRQTGFDAAEVTRLTAERQGMATANQGVEEAYRAQAATMGQPRPKVDLPQAQPPQLNPKDYEGLSYALIGLALVGGAKGMWTQASASLNGALKGYLDGHQQQAEEYWKKYEADFKAAKETEAQIDREIRDKLDAGNLTINEKLQAVKTLAAQYGLDDMRAAAEQKSIDGLWKQADARRSMWETKALAYQTRVGDWANKVQTQAQAAANRGGGNLGSLSPEDIKTRVEKGRIDPQSAYTGIPAGDRAGRRQISEAQAQDAAARGITGGDVLAAKAELGAATKALADNERRMAGVKRSTLAVKDLEPQVVALAKEIEPTGSRWINTPINKLRLNFTDAQKLQTLATEVTALGREHIIAVTMPVSGAQMHISAGELADRIINKDMPIGMLLGAIEGINADIAASEHALVQVRDDIVNRIKMLGGGTAPAAGGAPSPAAAAPLPQGWSVKVH